MNQDTQRVFFVRLLVISLVGAVAWHFLVGAKLDREQELKRLFALQTEEISQGEQEIALHADQLADSIRRMQKTRDEMMVHLDMIDSSKVHKILQDAADRYHLTISRVEPMRKSVDKRVRESDQDQDPIELEISEFRVECAGSFDGLVKFISELSEGHHLATVNSFRIIPVSAESARMSIQVSVYQISNAPKAFTETFKTATEPVEAKMTSAEGLNDETE